MFCSDFKKVDLVVWFGDDEPLYKETIRYDEEFMLNYALPRLEYFYCRAVLPEFFTNCVKNGFQLYLHDGWSNYNTK